MLKEYKSLSRMKLPAILSVIKGEAVISDFNIHKDEVVSVAIYNAQTEHELAQIIKYSYNYLPNCLSMNEWIEFCYNIKKGQTSRWFLEEKERRY